jgi:hypothetical protein
VVVTRNDEYVASLASPLRPDVSAAYDKAIHSLHPGMPIFPEMSTGASDARPFRVAESRFTAPMAGDCAGRLSRPRQGRTAADPVAVRQCRPLADHA